jgi:predicted DNA-binding protein with PD1-like motif
MESSFLVRLPTGEDLLHALTSEFERRSIRKAAFSVIGAVAGATLGYYDQVAKQYRNKEFQGRFEILACVGNVSEKEGQIFVHAHALLAGADFICFGGHLVPGTPIFAAELSAVEVPGEPPVRGLDAHTGLFLWPVGARNHETDTNAAPTE